MGLATALVYSQTQIRKRHAEPNPEARMHARHAADTCIPSLRGETDPRLTRTSSSHRDRGRNPRTTATNDRAYDSARPPLSLRGLSTTPYSHSRFPPLPVREDAAVVSAEHWAVRRHESRELATCVARERDGDEIQQDA